MNNEDYLKIEVLGLIPDNLSTEDVLSFFEHHGKMTKVIFHSIIKKAAACLDAEQWRNYLIKLMQLRVKAMNYGRYSEKDAHFLFWGLALREAIELEEFKNYMNSNRTKLEHLVAND
jgi:hypothetical protein